MLPKRYMDCQISSEIFKQAGLSLIERVVLAIVWDLARREEGCHATNEFIAEHCEVTNRSVSEAIKKLAMRGYINVINVRNRRVILQAEKYSLDGKFFTPNDCPYARKPSGSLENISMGGGTDFYGGVKKTAGGVENISTLGRKKQHTDSITTNSTIDSTKDSFADAAIATPPAGGEFEKLVLFFEDKKEDPTPVPRAPSPKLKKEAKPKAEHGALHQALIELWCNYIKQRTNVKFHVDGKAAKAMQGIREKLITAAKDYVQGANVVLQVSATESELVRALEGQQIEIAAYYAFRDILAKFYQHPTNAKHETDLSLINRDFYHLNLPQLIKKSKYESAINPLHLANGAMEAKNGRKASLSPAAGGESEPAAIDRIRGLLS